MSDSTPLPRLIDYDRWANSRTLETLKPLASGPGKGITLLAHVYPWLGCLDGQNREY